MKIAVFYKYLLTIIVYMIILIFIIFNSFSLIYFLIWIFSFGYILTRFKCENCNINLKEFGDLGHLLISVNCIKCGKDLRKYKFQRKISSYNKISNAKKISISLEMANILKKMLNNENSVEFTEYLFFKYFADNEIFDWSHLHHYFDDEEIRKECSDYKEFQNNELKKLIHHLKKGDIQKAGEISFLQESPNIID